MPVERSELMQRMRAYLVLCSPACVRAFISARNECFYWGAHYAARKEKNCAQHVFYYLLLFLLLFLHNILLLQAKRVNNIKRVKRYYE